MMSRSRKKSPYISTTCCGDRAGAEKSYKVAAHRALRRTVKMAIRAGEYDVLPHDKEYGDPWLGPKDGKWRLDPIKDAKYLRK
jgi:hypothetical protein